MKILKITFFTVFSLILLTNAWGQCNFPDYPDYLASGNPTNNGNGGEPWILNLAIHVVKSDGGWYGQNVDEVDEAIQILNDDFAQANIQFEVVQIDEIRNSSWIDTLSMYPDDCELDQLMNTNNRADAINIYMLGNNTKFRRAQSLTTVNDWDAQGNGIPGNSFVIGGNIDGTPLYIIRDDYNVATSHIISHEMGHCLGLFHTFNGMVRCAANNYSCPELVDGSNGDVCGDFVEDTPADPTRWEIRKNKNATLQSCGWYAPDWKDARCDPDQGSLDRYKDENGDSYAPAFDNFMAYMEPGCMSTFTPGQITRMSMHIENHPDLQQRLRQDKVDLVTRDDTTYGDYGQDENIIPVMWESPDIWARNQQDGFENQTHQNPDLHTNPTPYIYVKVTNRGTLPSSASGNKLYLFWAKANGNFPFPDVWTGQVTYDNGTIDVPSGGLIGVLDTIPVIEPDRSKIVRFKWDNAPDPNLYQGISDLGTDVHHTCLLSMIFAPNEDPEVFTDGSQIGDYVRKNNNIAWKNMAVTHDPASAPSPLANTDHLYDTDGDGVFILAVDDIVNAMMNQLTDCIVVGNVGSTQPGQPAPQPITSDIVVEVSSNDGSRLTDVSNVHVSMNESMYNAWKRSGSQSSGVTAMKSVPNMSMQGRSHNNSSHFENMTSKEWFDMDVEGTTDERAEFKNVVFEVDEIANICFTITYPTTSPEFDDDNYQVRVIQTNSETGQNLGGFTYNIQKPDCPNYQITSPTYSGGGVLCDVKLGCSQKVVMQAHSSSSYSDDNVLFVWKDNNTGKIVGFGETMEVTPTKSTTYQLQTMTRHGCIAESSVDVIIDKRYLHEIKKITPNPVKNGSMVVEYNAEEATSAELEIVKYDGTVSQTVPLDPTLKQKTIGVGQLNNGLYKVRLKCNGREVDTKNFVKQ